MSENEDDNGMRAILQRAFPDTNYITQTQLNMLEERLDSKLHQTEITMMQRLKASEAAQKNWVLTGCLAILLTSSAGYISIVVKLDRLTEALPDMQETLDHRRTWMERKDQRDDRQDQELVKAHPDYVPMPYVESPK